MHLETHSPLLLVQLNAVFVLVHFRTLLFGNPQKPMETPRKPLRKPSETPWTPLPLRTPRHPFPTSRPILSISLCHSTQAYLCSPVVFVVQALLALRFGLALDAACQS